MTFAKDIRLTPVRIKTMKRQNHTPTRLSKVLMMGNSIIKPNRPVMNPLAKSLTIYTSLPFKISIF